MERLLAGFAPGRAPDRSGYEDLFRYLLEGFLSRQSRHGARARYPGLPSSHGVAIDDLEGFSRSAPLWGAWVRSGRPGAVVLRTGQIVDLAGEFRRGLLAGTDPESAEYWGDVRDRDQRIVEASDVALGLWLFRSRVWDELRAPEKTRVVSWLRQVHGKDVWDNNWHLFPVLVHAVLRSLGEAGDADGAARHYARLREFHRGDGWFSDGPGEVFDYYNAWGIHYALAWLGRIDPAWDPGFLAGVRREFLAGYRTLIGPAGFPVLGRSVCYRIAVTAPLVLGQETDPRVVSPAEARRGLDATWSYFIGRGALDGGRVTQGYFGDDARTLESYSGPASPLWSARSLIAAFSLPEESPFWSSPAGRLPVEEASYELDLGPPGWRVTGDRGSGAIRIEVLANREARDEPLEEMGGLDRLLGRLLRTARRPSNRKARYGRRFYGSDAPFCCGEPREEFAKASAGPAEVAGGTGGRRRSYFFRV